MRGAPRPCEEPGRGPAGQLPFEFRIAWGPDDVRVAALLNELGLVREFAGDLAEARRLFERALAIQERWLGPDAFELVATLNDISRVIPQGDEFWKAESTAQRALSILGKTRPPDDKDLAPTLRNLGAYHGILARTRIAFQYFQRSVAIGSITGCA